MCFGVKLFLAQILAQLLAHCVALSSLVLQIPDPGSWPGVQWEGGYKGMAFSGCSSGFALCRFPPHSPGGPTVVTPVHTVDGRQRIDA